MKSEKPDARTVIIEGRGTSPQIPLLNPKRPYAEKGGISVGRRRERLLHNHDSYL
jgi:hypothetical protein